MNSCKGKEIQMQHFFSNFPHPPFVKWFTKKKRCNCKSSGEKITCDANHSRLSWLKKHNSQVNDKRVNTNVKVVMNNFQARFI